MAGWMPEKGLMMPRTHLFTSESVSMGHPDKMADQISDAVLDAMLAVDPKSRVACETMITTGMVIIAGEVTCDGYVDIAKTVRDTVREIGYTDGRMGFDADSCAVLVSLDQQSPDIAQGVNVGDGLHKEQGAGDQGLMFGFACRETPTLMPLPIDLSHNLVAKHAEARRAGTTPNIPPAAKSQVTIDYACLPHTRVEPVVLSTQLGPQWTYSQPGPTTHRSAPEAPTTTGPPGTAVRSSAGGLGSAGEGPSQCAIPDHQSASSHSAAVGRTES